MSWQPFMRWEAIVAGLIASTLVLATIVIITVVVLYATDKQIEDTECKEIEDAFGEVLQPC